MGRIPDKLRQIIAANIRAERMKKFPGRGGSKKCAEAFGVSPQQWSPWEHGMRTPDELRLQQLADFFGVTVDHMRHDHSAPANTPPRHPAQNELHCPEPSLNGLSCSESEIIWQLHKIYSGQSSQGRRVHVSLNIVLSEDKKS